MAYDSHRKSAVTIDYPPIAFRVEQSKGKEDSVRSMISIGFCGILLCAIQPCHAAFTSLGPTPYLSAADSPFAEFLGSENFYLEDFEDGMLNTPGISQTLDTATHGVINSPGTTTNSVDLDDGVQDGSGASGYSLQSVFFAFRPTDPPISTSFLRFAFDPTQLPQLPNTFGFVWTGGTSDSRVVIEAFNDESLSLATAEFLHLGVGNTGVADDRFLGLRIDGGISFIEIRAIYTGEARPVEIDHVQYGMIVPEPSLHLMLMCAISFGFSRRVR